MVKILSRKAYRPQKKPVQTPELNSSLVIDRLYSIKTKKFKLVKKKVKTTKLLHKIPNNTFKLRTILK